MYPSSPDGGPLAPVSSTTRKEAQAEIMRSTHTLAKYISNFADWPYQVPILAVPRKSYADFEQFTAREINSLADKAAGQLVSQGLRQLPERECVTVTMLGVGNTAYAATMLALTKLGYTVFLMSPRLSSSTIAALLTKANSNIMVHAADMPSKMESVKGLQTLRTIPMISREELESMDQNIQPMVYNTEHWTKSSKIAIIFHSSGSTGVPKIFPISQDTFMARLRSNMTGNYAETPLFITSALYNSAGSTFLLSALANSEITYFYNDSLSYTAEGLTQVLVQARPNVVIIVPYALGQLASTRPGLEALKECRSVNAFGAVCPSQLGNKLVDEGVHLNSGYAMSETSTLMTSAFRNPSKDKAWDYMAPYSFTKDHIWMKPLGGDLFECVILQGLALCPSSNSDDPPGSFYTSDVFIKHPSLPDRWRLIARKDDCINMSFSETFVALPFEDHVKQHPFVEEAVIFGNGRPRLGILIFWSEETKALNTAELVGQIMPLIEDMNAQSKPWTRILADMIISVPYGANWPRTDKQNIVRPQVYRQYEQLIDEKYEHMDESSIIEPKLA